VVVVQLEESLDKEKAKVEKIYQEQDTMTQATPLASSNLSYTKLKQVRVKGIWG